MKQISCIGLFVIMLFAKCGDKHTTQFTQLSRHETGIDFRNLLVEDENLNITRYIYFYNGAGLAVGDVNNDGLPDIFFTGNMVRNRLFLNKGNFRFEDITEKSQVAGKQGWCTGATMVDINQDGLLDIYICRSADDDPERRKNLLYINNGDLTFTEKAEEYHLADAGYSTQAVFFDYDKDGDLDMFLINHSLSKYSIGVIENTSWKQQRNNDFACKLYRNDWSEQLHHPVFTDVSQQAGITSNLVTFGLGVVVSDINNDGWPDVYTTNDFSEPDYLFINNHNGTFSQRFNACMDYGSFYSMGCDAADVNNDGLTDILTVDMLPEDNATQKMHSGAENFDQFQMLVRNGYDYQYSRNMLQRNNGDGTFSEIGQLAGVSNTDWSWAPLFADFDNDGRKDIFVSNGYLKDYSDMDFIKYMKDRTLEHKQNGQETPVKDIIKHMPDNLRTNYIYQNKGNAVFENKTADWGFTEKAVASGAVYADLDNDGDLDLIVSNTNDFAGVFRNNNETLHKANYLKIKLKGDKKNITGIGAKVKLFCKGEMYYQEQFPVRGYQSSMDQVLTFGLGGNKVCDSLVVIWPDDHFQEIKNIQSNQTLVLDKKNAGEIWHYDAFQLGERKYFTEKQAPAFEHHENNFNDFTVQPLMPNYLSRQGPCMAVGDINDDGLEDVFFGNAKGSASSVFLQHKDGAFTKISEPAFERDSANENTAAEFFDADNDGDMDLFVCSGGYEFSEKDPALRSRLYLNDGKGKFVKKENALPAMATSASCVKAADINGDGYMDLFVGGRVVPGKYPEAPASYVLINDGKGNFSDQTVAVAPALRNIGMVTDAVWMDLNNDHQPDLIVVGEWMPIKVFINHHGKLEDESSRYIRFPSSGWWNKIYAADFDGDGDLDLVIGNCGTNTQFKVSEKEPMEMYYKDFDGNGSLDPITCYYIQGVSYPAFSRDDISGQLPMLKKKFLEYKSYSTATVTDLFSPEQLRGASVLKAEEMHTVYLENRGSEGFLRHELPVEAQYSPIYAIASADVNRDGKKDLILAGNNSWTRIRYGKYAANHGIVLTGDGKGGFSYMPQYESGLQIRDDVRSVAFIKDCLIIGVNNKKVRAFKLSKN